MTDNYFPYFRLMLPVHSLYEFFFDCYFTFHIRVTQILTEMFAAQNHKHSNRITKETESSTACARISNDAVDYEMKC